MMQGGLKKIICGICLIFGGLFIIIPLIVYISKMIVYPVRPRADLIITINLWLIFFCFLIFFLPAIYLIYTSKPSPPMIYSGAVLAWFVTITTLTLFCIIIITISGGIIARTSDGIDFETFFYSKFGYCLVIGFIFSFLVICFSLITAKLNN
ncbi:MAG: hypothetical protein ACFE9X_17585 [Promethearchaeota archaeon]